MKNVNNFTKIILTSVMISFTAVGFAQDKKEEKKEEKQIERPATVGHSTTDSFVDSAFDVYEKNQELTKKLGDIKNHAGEVKSIKADLEAQQIDVTTLLQKSDDVLKDAKTITPKTNSMKAVKAISQATKALNATKDALPAQIEQIKTQTAE